MAIYKKIIITLLVLFNSCTYDYWNVFTCNIKNAGKLYCDDNIKKICNYNSKLEYVFISGYCCSTDCTAKGMICNVYNDGQYSCTDEIEFVPFDIDPEGNNNYWEYRCCVPAYLQRGDN